MENIETKKGSIIPARYYEPDTDDFFVGMEYSIEADEVMGIWEPCKVDTLFELMEVCKYNQKYIGKYSNIRIKTLDKKDFDDLEFIYDEENSYEKEHKSTGKYIFSYTYRTKDNLKILYLNWFTGNEKNEYSIVKIWDEFSYNLIEKDEPRVVFLGRIKNKAELLRILNMLRKN